MERISSWRALVAVFVIGLLAIVAVMFTWGFSTPFDQGADASQYLSIARSVASGHGYKNTVGPWPEQTTYDRMPGWPALLTLAFWIAPASVNPYVVARIADAICLALAGVFAAMLARRTGVRQGYAILAGLGVSLSPVLLYLAVSGMSEIPFVMVTVLGMLLLLADGPAIYAGAFLLSYGAMIRTNMILFPVVLLGLAVLFPAARRILWLQRKRVVIALLVFAAMPLAWAVRNYTLVGRFPFLSSIEGETFYGGNNDFVATYLPYWGYWAMPDLIPGETPKLELAKTLKTDVALNDYYHAKGVAWIRTHKSALPRLLVGKLVRAFVPVPWVPDARSDLVFGYRALLDVLFLALLPLWWPVMSRRYLLLALALFTVNLVTILMYWGVYRFTHVFAEIFYIPCILCGFQRLIENRRASSPVSAV